MDEKLVPRLVEASHDVVSLAHESPIDRTVELADQSPSFWEVVLFYGPLIEKRLNGADETVEERHLECLQGLFNK